MRAEWKKGGGVGANGRGRENLLIAWENIHRQERKNCLRIVSQRERKHIWWRRVSLVNKQHWM